ncbi:PAS domain S-box protein [Rhodopila sp.]|uniref:PAS domain S-box protein n=1 Tax=Rhodopila sp. TaxID=2480087 RepID=UPI003D0C13EE
MIRLFSQQGLSPHGFCLLWQPELVWLHAFSDAMIGVAYYAIPLALAFLVIRHRDLAFGWMFWLFALFILACGTTHFMEIWVLWHPDYAVQGLLKAFTALASISTACLLWLHMPRLQAIPTPGQLRRIADQLADETVRHEQTVEQLYQSEESFRLIVESVRDCAMFMLDKNGFVTSWNGGAERIKRYAAEDIVGRHFGCFYVPEDQANDAPAQGLAVAMAEGQHQEDAWRLRADGSRFLANVIINPVFDRAGVHIGFAQVTRDITEEHHAREALGQARLALAQSQKMQAVGQLTGGIAHDFNNMLTAILGSLELLDKHQEKFSQATYRMLCVIRKAADHGTELTRRLLAFSRKQMLTPAVTDVNRLVSGLSDMLGRTLGESVAIETQLAGGLWPVFIDRNQLESALLNLAVNARDAMPQGGSLTIETLNAFLDQDYVQRRDEVVAGEYVAIAISDSGTGMAADVLARAFEPFYTTKEIGQGTGLGLSQVFGFVKQSGGHLELYSEVGHGTTVKLYVPRHHAAVEAAALAAEPVLPLPVGSETVLVVEDDDRVRGYSVSAVRYLGYNTLEASSPAAALDIIRTRPDISLLFTDVGLPGMNGRELADQAIGSRPGLKVVYTTGYARTAITRQGMLERGVHLLPKPYKIESLARMLRSVMDEV